MNQAITLAALLVLGASSFAADLLEEASFESFPVTKRKSIAEGGDISKGSREWTRFKDHTEGDGGKIILGLTSEFAHTGRQSVFVKFDQVTKPAVATLASEPISILPGKPYRVSIWGLVDATNPVALDQKLPYLQLRVDWFGVPPKEGEEEDTNPLGLPDPVGEAVFKLQPLPGAKKRTKMLFNSKKWTEFFADVKSPSDAATMKVTWTWETKAGEGVSNGVMYFDDAAVVGESGPKEDLFAEDEAAAEEEEKKAAAASKTPDPKAAEVLKSAAPTEPKSIDVTPLNTPPPRAKKPENK